MDFAVFGTVLRNGHEDLFRMGTYYGKLDQICGVEEHIGVFLIWIYPLHLGAADIRPVHDRFAGRKRSLVEIAYDASEETVVACRDTVVVIQRDACDRVDEDPVFA